MNDHPNYTTAVENLQRYLRFLSYSNPSIPIPPIDGIFESRTEDALREFQRLRGLPPTGRADRTTWELLYADYRAALALHSPPRQLSVFPIDPEGYVILPNAQGFAVTAIQYMLLELQHHYRELENVALTGVYDQQTQDAVRFFQKRNGLPTDANVGLLTWNSLTDQYNTLFWRTTDE